MPAVCKRLVVVGVGLIGGSIASAARQRGVASQVVGVVRSDRSRARAQACGVCDEVTTDLKEAANGADLVIACTPVAEIAATLQNAAACCSPQTILTDAGSTKAEIVQKIESALSAAPSQPPAFVGGHPLAGDHRTGPEAARADLFDGRVVVLTPTAGTQPAAKDRVSKFWRSLGAEVVEMSPADHDAALAKTSHLPHLASAAVAAATPGDLLRLVGSGWKDTTRVAAGDPTLWRDILVANKQEVLASLASLEETMADYRTAIASDDQDRLLELLEQGRQRRDAVGD